MTGGRWEELGFRVQIAESTLGDVFFFLDIFLLCFESFGYSEISFGANYVKCN